jgi:hypothetical protein
LPRLSDDLDEVLLAQENQAVFDLAGFVIIRNLILSANVRFIRRPSAIAVHLARSAMISSTML